MSQSSPAPGSPGQNHPKPEHTVHTATAVIDNGVHGTREIRLETGRLARLAAGSVVAYLGDTMILSATTASKQPREHLDFFPLTVDVEEKLYAVGRIPGSFFRREGRPSEEAILTCRLTDRPLRPSFTKGLRNEVQVVLTVLSLDQRDLYDVVAINAASASTMLAGLPFSGPVGATRVARPREVPGDVRHRRAALHLLRHVRGGLPGGRHRRRPEL
jgi:polyribonucleotide nucleotidyltransferase